MDYYTWFFGICMFFIGMIAGRLTMAIQYEVMKSIAKSGIKKNEKMDIGIRKKPVKLEYEHAKDDSPKKDFYEYMKNRPRK